MKTCTKCGEAQPPEAFSRNPRYKDGLNGWCRACHRGYSKVYDQAHQAERQTRYQASREVVLARQKAKREADPEGARLKNRDYNRVWRDNNRGLLRVKRLARYGLTVERYEAILAEQGGGCAICGKSEPDGRGDFHVDHDHVDGLIRGFLCHSCNTGLGLFGDNPELLQAAAAYLHAAKRLDA